MLALGFAALHALSVNKFAATSTSAENSYPLIYPFGSRLATNFGGMQRH